jgi:hypothetical protein
VIVDYSVVCKGWNYFPTVHQNFDRSRRIGVDEKNCDRKNAKVSRSQGSHCVFLQGVKYTIKKHAPYSPSPDMHPDLNR